MAFGSGQPPIRCTCPYVAGEVAIRASPNGSPSEAWDACGTFTRFPALAEDRLWKFWAALKNLCKLKLNSLLSLRNFSCKQCIREGDDSAGRFVCDLIFHAAAGGGERRTPASVYDVPSPSQLLRFKTPRRRNNFIKSHDLPSARLSYKHMQ